MKILVVKMGYVYRKKLAKKKIFFFVAFFSNLSIKFINFKKFPYKDMDMEKIYKKKTN